MKVQGTFAGTMQKQFFEQPKGFLVAFSRKVKA
ncbi:hypothetical protein SAMN05421578_104220 [Paenibacillus macquariensis]|uniref:Uncharacterized protein n=1 Tax=Paenibacillus macquariensis TaxID=948756 RepID=A0ABY1JV40_9BACL|nr:hypothetical protein SAMN05421578_104220 [Paenibacillus macquariensis]